MNTGFYNLKNFTVEELKTFFTDCLKEKKSVNIEHLPLRSMSRKPYTKGEIHVDNCVEKLIQEKTHSVFIDRKVQHPNHPDDFECGFSNDKVEKYRIYIFIYLSRSAGEKLIKKYKLKEITI